MRKMGAIGLASFALLLAGCSQPASPAPTSPTPAPAQTSTRGLSGIVVDENGRPITGAQVDNGYGAGAWAITDANGAFVLPGTSVDPMLWVRSSKAGYAQPCTTPITGLTPVTAQMVSLASLTGDPRPSPSGFRTVSGVVQQMTSIGLQVVSGAWVDFEPAFGSVNDWPAAVTFTDGNGRFSLCGLPLDTVGIVAVLNTGASYGSATVPPSQASVVLTLQPIK